MRIAIDIDDTISNTKKNNLDILKKYNYKETCKQDFKNNEFEEFIFNHKDEILETMEPILYASDAIKELYQNNKIIIISSRRIKDYVPYEETINFFEKYDIPFDSMYLGKDNKGIICHDLGIDLIIDDSEINLLDCAKYGIRTIKYGKSKNFIAYDNWLDLKDYVKEVANGEDYRWQKVRRRKL